MQRRNTACGMLQTKRRPTLLCHCVAAASPKASRISAFTVGKPLRFVLCVSFRGLYDIIFCCVRRAKKPSLSASTSQLAVANIEGSAKVSRSEAAIGNHIWHIHISTCTFTSAVSAALPSVVSSPPVNAAPKKEAQRESLVTPPKNPTSAVPQGAGLKTTAQATAKIVTAAPTPATKPPVPKETTVSPSPKAVANDAQAAVGMQSASKCPGCGDTLAPNCRFCTNCGMKFPATAATPVTMVAPAPKQAQPSGRFTVIHIQ
jgi:hypothetical protein